MDIWSFIINELEKENRVMLITVIAVRGSSPGKRGFKMAVSSGGQIFGSIGGGVMEYKMVELAREIIPDTSQKAFLKWQIHDPNAGEDASGLICAGSQLHAFTPLSSADLEQLQTLRTGIEKGTTGFLKLSVRGVEVVQDMGSENPDIFEGAAWRYTEQLQLPETLYIFGGGHISLPLSQIARLIGLRVVVLDDRESLNTMEQNSFAHKKMTIDYADAATHIIHPPASFVCIMTVGHGSDQLILEQMLHLPLKYLGMIGSKKKIQKIFSSLGEKGFTAERLDAVDAPMGIPINDELPEEIAVSIAAGIIKIKNKKETR